jgi:hypothetical protein
MQLDFAHICDYAYVGDGGKYYILGEFRFIRVPKVPTRHERLFLAFRVLANKVEVRDTVPKLQIEVTDGDGNPIVPRSPEFPMPFQPLGPEFPALHQAQVIMEMGNFALPKLGDYTFHLFANGNLLGQVTFNVQLVQPPSPAA